MSGGDVCAQCLGEIRPDGRCECFDNRKTFVDDTALLRQALSVLEENLEFVESYGENSGAYVEGTYIPTINALRERLGVTE